jgi:hypothetical protein
MLRIFFAYKKAFKIALMPRAVVGLGRFGIL